MKTWLMVGLGCGFALLLGAAASACTLCTLNTKPLSHELPQYPLVVFGPVVDASLNPDGVTGSCTVRVDKVFRDTADNLSGKKTLVINKYTPPNPSVRYLLFLRYFAGKHDVVRVWDLSTDRLVKYVENAPPKNDEDKASRLARLRYFFQFLMDEEPQIAMDAYSEWAQSQDSDVVAVAPTLDASKLRTWLQSPKTPAHCLSLFGYLLGACGTKEDAALLHRMILNPDSRMANALDGMLAGYIHQNGEEGWKLAKSILGDANRSFIQRLTVHRMLIFFYNAKSDENKSPVLSCMEIILNQPDMMDIATEQLRKWRIWDFTDTILQKYRSGQATSIITKKKIIRYAITCPQPQAQEFLKEIDPDEVRRLRQDLEFEAPPIATNGK